MLKPNLSVAIFSSSVFFLTLVVKAESYNLCRDVFADPQTYSKIVDFNFNDDLRYLEESQKIASAGVVDSFYSDQFSTQFYYTKTATRNYKLQKTPLVDPQAKAVYVFLHGSGTMKSGGRNFLANMNTLAKLGFAGVSFDMPYHSDGPRDLRFYKSDFFMNWLYNIIVEVRKSGKPVILVGHSFGPDVAFEFATRYPYMVEGVVGLSPAGFTRVLSKWYDNYTSKMNFGGDVESNDQAGYWAGAMSEQFLWSKQKLADPTKVNRRLNMRILSGNREEYVPAPVGGVNRTPVGENFYDVSGPLQKIFSHAVVTIEPGIGHYLFEHQDKDGYNVVLRELLLAANVSLSEIKKIQDQVREQALLALPYETLGKKFDQDGVFRSWFKSKYSEKFIGKIMNAQNSNLAQKILDEYAFALKDREMQIYLRIIATKETDPEFYDKFKEKIDSYNPKKIDTGLFAQYQLFLREKKTLSAL